MKFLYIAAEHVSGALTLLQNEHRRRGDECRYVTFFPSRWHFPDDICLHLPFMPNRSWIVKVRKALSPEYRADDATLPRPPYWNPNVVARALFSLRDSLNWPGMASVIKRFGLTDFDVITLDGGLDFTRDCRFAASCKARGAHISSFYHGTDLRNRGIVPAVDKLIELRLTSEWDLLDLDSRLRYLYLPIDTSQFVPRPYGFHSPIRIAHAARNEFKGTAALLRAIRALSDRHKFELHVFRGTPHANVLRVMRECDIVVDQLTNAGGWGYGMTSLEALAFGLPVITNIPPQMQLQLGEHPFIQADEASIEHVLQRLIADEAAAAQSGAKGLAWVKSRHDIQTVGDQLYQYYAELGWLTSRSS